MRRAWGIVLVAAGLVSHAPLLSAEGREQPYEVARRLAQVQDRVVLGEEAAIAEHAHVLAHLGEIIEGSDPTLWRERRNIQALAIYLVTGGPVQPVRRLLGRGGEPGSSKDVVSALIAFAERRPEARELLAAIDAAGLDPAMGGAVALAQAIAFHSEPARARSYLALARLLSPGTLVDESAARREITMLLDEKKSDAALAAAGHYLWRFAASPYAAEVTAFLASNVLPEVAKPAGHLKLAEPFLQGLPRAARHKVLLELAGTGARSGHLGLAAAAARRAAVDASEADTAGGRGQLYEAMSKAFDVTVDGSADDLIAIERDRLADADRGLVDAARAVVRAVRAPVGAAPVAPETIPTGIENARRALARADQSLEEPAP